ncbi:hypothetical protein VDG1235_1874 [Verrucomicrobiia bacterium DG1235]|nr:hypothetical protein VDG1235_1874 [Verrucomicrobiae bacterium DG1235]
MKSKIRFCIFFSVFFIIGLSTIPTIHYRIDRWRVLNEDIKHAYNIVQPHPRVNASFLRVSHLIKNKENFNSVIFGSSRVFHGFGTEQLNETLGGKWYKLTYPGGAPYEHLHNLKTLISHGVELTNVIFALDDADLYRLRDDYKLYNFYPHPSNSFEWIKYYIFYLFKPVTFEDLDILKGNRKLIEFSWTIENYTKRGHELPSNFDLDKHKKKLLKQRPHGLHLLKQDPRSSELLTEISETIKLCREKNIRINFFITPRFHKTLYARDRNTIDEFKRRLTEITNFYDFTEVSEYTQNPKYWLDTSHYTSELGSILLNELSGKVHNAKPFGYLAKRGNIDIKLEKIRKDLITSLPLIKKTDKTLVIHESLLEGSNIAD